MNAPTACVVCGKALDPAGTVALPRDPANDAWVSLETYELLLARNANPTERHSRQHAPERKIERPYRHPELYHDPHLAAAVVDYRTAMKAVLFAATDALDALRGGHSDNVHRMADTLAFGRADAGIIIEFLDVFAVELDAEATHHRAADREIAAEAKDRQAARVRGEADVLRDALWACGECGAGRAVGRYVDVGPPRAPGTYNSKQLWTVRK